MCVTQDLLTNIQTNHFPHNLVDHTHHRLVETTFSGENDFPPLVWFFPDYFSSAVKILRSKNLFHLNRQINIFAIKLIVTNLFKK